MRKLSADIIFPIAGSPIQEGVVVVDADGKILQVDERKNHDPSSIEIYRGAIVPGFINTHCHLELSHMKGRVDTGTGLIPFIRSVVSFREVPMEEILTAIEKADQEMYDAGIVAVGDISNKLDTAATKARSPIRYYSFVEMFDFLQEANADSAFQQYMEVYRGQADGAGNRKSCVPHAPYSVSKQLFHLINEQNVPGSTVSIHNQETIHENMLFLEKSGDLLDFYGGFNIPLDAFKPTGKKSINYALDHMDPNCRTLFVHNTMSDRLDIEAAQAWSPHTYLATFANANLYIE
ncbi:MAG: amidohydrolase family protein, partial [Phaeodactylibacter sp.]|nr:amidohydrolase family protein [Phaeodactylibacter sp.]